MTACLERDLLAMRFLHSDWLDAIGKPFDFKLGLCPKVALRWCPPGCPPQSPPARCGWLVFCDGWALSAPSLVGGGPAPAVSSTLIARSRCDAAARKLKTNTTTRATSGLSSRIQLRPCKQPLFSWIATLLPLAHLIHTVLAWVDDMGRELGFRWSARRLVQKLARHGGLGVAASGTTAFGSRRRSQVVRGTSRFLAHPLMAGALHY